MLKTNGVKPPHHACGGLAQSLRGVIYLDDNNPFELKKGYNASETRVACKQKTKSNT